MVDAAGLPAIEVRVAQPRAAESPGYLVFDTDYPGAHWCLPGKRAEDLGLVGELIRRRVATLYGQAHAGEGRIRSFDFEDFKADGTLLAFRMTPLLWCAGGRARRVSKFRAGCNQAIRPAT